MKTPATTSQTVGPYFNLGLAHLYRDQLTHPELGGGRITIHGRLLDSEGKPVSDAILETWQADAEGNYAEVSRQEFFGFGRIPTDENGSFRFSTIKPGSVPAPDGTRQAPHILVSIFMRGLLLRLITRIYFAGDPLNANDFVLQRVDPERRTTLMAKPAPNDPATFEWNIILQGDNETVFFDC